MANNRLLQYVAYDGTEWRTLVEQFEYGYWLRQQWRKGFYGAWHIAPMREETKFEDSQTAREYAEELRHSRIASR